MSYYLRTYPKRLFLVLSVILLLILSGCAESAKSEEEILNDLRQREDFISPSAKISDYEIIKRQTDIQNKSDLIYITVYTNEPELTCTLSYIMRYELYNDGWILESVIRDMDGPWSIEGLPEEKLVADIRSFDPFFANYEAKYGRFESIQCEVSDEWYTDYTVDEKSMAVSLTAIDTLTKYRAQYYVDYSIIDGQWCCTSVDSTEFSYVPVFLPKVSASDKIMDTLNYDSYEYSHAEEDFENHAAILYYTAQKVYELGTETFTVKIPLKFEISFDDSDQTMWTYNQNTIQSTLDDVTFSEETWIRLSNIINSLGTDNAYDNYEYSHMEMDFQNYAATIYYTAQNVYALYTETYEIEIPINFSLPSDDNQSMWSYRRESIHEILHDIDLSRVEGTWSGSGEFYEGPWHARITISDIAPNGSSGYFSANVLCDISWSYWWNTPPEVCKTNDTIQVNIIPESYYYVVELPGKFRIKIVEWFDTIKLQWKSDDPVELAKE